MALAVQPDETITDLSLLLPVSTAVEVSLTVDFEQMSVSPQYQSLAEQALASLAVEL